MPGPGVNGAPRQRAIDWNAYTPWINHSVLAGVVATKPIVHSFKRPVRGPGAPPSVAETDHTTPLRNRAVFYGVSYILYSRAKFFRGGKMQVKRVSFPVNHLTTTAEYVPVLRVGQPVVVIGEILMFKDRSGRMIHVLRSGAKPRLLWGRSGKFGAPEEFRPLIDDTIPSGEDFWEDLLLERGEVIPFETAGRPPNRPA